MKKKFKKRLYLILTLLIIVILLIVSCEKFNILGPTYIPPETDFRLPEETIPGHIDVNPVPAKDGEVFGGFSRKFKYQGKWYILADYMYEYEPKSITLNKKARNIILQIDDDGNIMIYDKNSKGYYDLLKMNVIEENRVLYEYYYYGDYKYSSTNFITKNCNDEDRTHSFITGITFNNEVRTSTDLINWKTEGTNNNIYKAFPFPNPNNPNASFQGIYGAGGYKIVEFKDYLYIIGLEEDFFEQNHPDGCRNESEGTFTVSKNVYYRIDKNKDTSIGGNWQKIDALWGKRSSLDIRYDENKIYVTKGRRRYYEWMAELSGWVSRYEKFENDNTIWSTADGVNWNTEPNSSAYNKANEISSYLLLGGYLPYIQKKARTPEEPNWVKLNDGRYYKSDNSPYETYEINNKLYYVPIPPYEEIREAYYSGQEYFTITEEHIKSAGLNQFLIKDKEPNKNEDWVVITPIDYTDKLMVWQSGGEKAMLNINNKAIQFVDYTQIEYMYSTIKEYFVVINDLRKTAKEYRNGTYWDDFMEEYIKDIYKGMQYDARADMLELLMNNREYIMPHDAVTHYTVEFKY